MQWDAILREKLNGILKIVQNRREADSNTDNYDDDDEEPMPEETGYHTYDTSERDGRHEPKQTKPEDDVIQIHIDGQLRQSENIEPSVRRSCRNTQKTKRYGGIPYTAIFWNKIMEAFYTITGTKWNARKGTSF